MKLTFLKQSIEQNINIHNKIINLHSEIKIASTQILKTLKKKNRVFICGNGGSAADAQHLAAEFLVRLRPDINRKPLPIISLAQDTSTITACANDYSFDKLFSRNLEALYSTGDLLITISTSGMSKNIINVLKFAKKNKIYSISLLGNKGGSARKITNLPIIIDSKNVARIQECHIFIGHIILEWVEDELIRKKNNMKKKALIYGITGQDGAYLAKFLLNKGYEVHGVKRRSSSFNTKRLDDIYTDPHFKTNFFLHYGDLTDSLSILKTISNISPHEIYNLAAQSHVKVSFDVPEYSANVGAIGTLRILDSIKSLNLSKKIKYYQAGSSEMFGAAIPPQNEKTNFIPRSPYAVSKLFAHWITVNYREAYNIFACNGILFNHESPIRGETFVTKKIVSALFKIYKNKQKKLFLGNLYSKRDWGHARDYVKAMWKMLQQKKPDDYVIATGTQYSVKQFINLCAKELKMNLVWKGKGINEKCFWNKKVIIEVDQKYFRPTEVDSLKGDFKKAKKKLKWKPIIGIRDLVKEMLDYEFKNDK